MDYLEEQFSKEYLKSAKFEQKPFGFNGFLIHDFDPFSITKITINFDGNDLNLVNS